ncbi:nucleoside hydrolase [Neisseria sp. Ec49-e6-T10]|uniref:nucleoside hydrolase n=1 Tax=Neisseria sp. Ec49-e6-T10 TaxID=3140744 RepID=UPI003EB93182
MTSIPKMIIDTDPGQDDAAAILFAFGLQNQKLVDIIALTCVAGNVPLHYTTKNARIICDWADKQNIPVFAGANKPLIKTLVTAEEVHGKTGLDGVPLHEPQTPLQTEHAVSFLIETLKKAQPNSITLCPVGPLTNIAQALSMAPECIQAIKEIVIMGGTFFEVGNITPSADFNFFVDPHAAKIVLQSGAPITIIPLDVTHKACLSIKRVQALRDLPNQNGTRLADILQSYERFDTQKFGLEGGPLHDPCAVAYAVFPELFKGKEVFVDVETCSELTQGASVVDWWHVWGKPKNAFWVNEIDDEQFFSYLTRAIATLP